MPPTVEPKAFDSLQARGVTPVKVPVDANAAARRLAKAVTFRTRSNQDRSDFDEEGLARNGPSCARHRSDVGRAVLLALWLSCAILAQQPSPAQAQAPTAGANLYMRWSS